MRNFIGTRAFGVALALASLAPLTGCASGSTFVRSDAALGRVVVYRNGVAYFERYAKVEGKELKLAVPQDKVDDFLKSLTVVDAETGKPAPVSYPTSGAQPDGDGLVRMTIQIPDAGLRELKLSYVTEAPSWKPSYRLTLAKDGKVDLQAWAIVDNTSGEDWQSVKLGVGSSSALSFRFDLRSVRLVQRETLESDLPFAMAPPTGGSPYNNAPPTKKVLGELTDAALAMNTEKELQTRLEETKATKTGARQYAPQAQQAPASRPAPAKPADARAGGIGMGRIETVGKAYGAVGGMPPPPPPDPISNMARQISANKQQVVIEGYAGKDDSDKMAGSLARANRMREQLIKNGVSPDLVVAVGAGEQVGRGPGVRVVEPPTQTKRELAPAGAKPDDGGALLSPIDTSHFESKVPMTVARGTSAMVSIYNGLTDGEVVYLYDPETARGNATYAFKSVRFKNPTDSALESGPVTVFGEGRFIGEGLSDSIPPKSAAFIPYALDRQIVVEKKEADREEIARILTVQRGVFSTEVQQIKKSTFTIQNRLQEKATVYVRHTVPQGMKLTKAPEGAERLGPAHLFKVTLEPGAKTDVVIEESSPVFKSTDIRSNVGMEMVKVFLTSAAVEAGLKDKVGELVKLQQEIANIEQKITNQREQMAEYRARMDELHVQLVTLKAVKTAGPLMQSLEKKLQEVSDKVSKATIDVVGLQEQLMVARIKFQDKVAELSLDKKDEPKKDEPKKDEPKKVEPKKP